MKSLDLIIANNARAAGRELGHAIEDGDLAKAAGIRWAQQEEIKRLRVKVDWDTALEMDDVFVAGHDAGRQEG